MLTGRTRNEQTRVRIMHLPKLQCHQPTEALRVYTCASVCQGAIHDEDISRQVDRITGRRTPRRPSRRTRPLPRATTPPDIPAAGRQRDDKGERPRAGVPARASGPKLRSPPCPAPPRCRQRPPVWGSLNHRHRVIPEVSHVDAVRVGIDGHARGCSQPLRWRRPCCWRHR